ncbi:apolipoprotein N-acyltransferase [Roseisalinus antarcticus]|uniref:Apolipoprotein N-acyltransferase n=1 Tax=Roseisalinus antarcticus TaxID=254357 RepID=A0A1Y5TR62_9RHOB|nr:apolipoprotein N-acyltransferase [Roseisalinus antarcticus]SLN70132.1 Apolipoprotein N-acyltransferase [Roseisalinus antarcticus]
MADTIWAGPRWRRMGAALGLGALAALGQAPVGFAPATLVALALILWLMRGAPRWPAAAWFGWCAGTGYFLVALHWIVEPFLVDVARDGWMAPFALVFMAGGLALFWALAFGLSARRGPLLLGLALVLAEYLRSVVMTGFPWVLLGHIWIGTSVGQLASLFGAHGLTAITVLLACVPSLWPGRGSVRAAAGLAAAALVWGAATAWDATLPEIAPPADAPIVRLVQPNAPQDEKWQPGKAEMFFRRQLAFTAEGPRPDLTVWPETSVPYWLDQADAALELVTEASRGAPVVVGIQRRDWPRLYNSLLVLGETGGVADRYDKAHLVPFGEYIPFGGLLARFGIHGLAANEGGGYTPGPGGRTVDIAGIGPALPLICYEGIFAEEIGAVAPRPRFMLLITNDAWFGQVAGPYQHLAQARLRAIEQGLPMVRVANTGISAMIDARGRLVEIIPMGEAGWRDVALPPALPPTLYAHTGDGPVIWVLLAAFALNLLLARRKAIEPRQPVA